MNIIIKGASGFMGLFDTGAETFVSWVSGIVPTFSLSLINNDINKFVIKNSIYIVNGSPNDPQCTFSLYL